jgi:hypothetical protein
MLSKAKALLQRALGSLQNRFIRDCGEVIKDRRCPKLMANGLNVSAFKMGEEMWFISTSVLNSLNPTQMANP